MSKPKPKPTELSPKRIARQFARPEHRFINRELSWLAFNNRVLDEAKNPHVPLLERVKFLSISATNLDEFTMVRIAELMDQMRDGVHTLSTDGLSPTHQLARIHEEVGRLLVSQQQCWLELLAQLQQESIEIVSPQKLNKADIGWLKDYFADNIFPLLTPVAVDPAHPFPFIPNLGLVQVLELSRARRTAKRMIAMVPFPPGQPRFIRLGVGKGIRLMLLEDVITLCFDELFPGYVLHEAALFRIVRDSDIDLEDEAEDLMRTLDLAVKKRRLGRVVRVKTHRGTTPKLLQFMLQHLPAAPKMWSKWKASWALPT